MQKKLHTFRLDVTSEETGEHYEGQFTCKKLSILDQTRIKRRASELSGGMYCVRDDQGNPTGQGIDEETEFINMAISTCEVALIKGACPQWWDLEEVSEWDLLVAVFKEVQQYQSTFRKSLREKDRSDGSSVGGEETGSGEREGTGSVHNAPKMVDKQVQAAMDA